MARPTSGDVNRRRFLQGTGATALTSLISSSPATAATSPTSAEEGAAAAAPPYLVDGRYDFDTPYPRVGSLSTKWDKQIDRFGDGIQVGMGIADLDFRAAPCIGEAMRERMAHENWGYLDGDLGFTSLKEAICDWNRDRHGVTVDPDTIVIETGVHPGLITAIKTFSPPGSRVLMMTPTYNGFYSDLRFTNTIANESEMIFEGDHYRIDWDDLEARMTPDTHTMLLCNPQNPTGNVWSPEDLLRIGELCLKHRVVVLADEIHADFVRPGFRYTPFASLPDRAIVDNSITFKAATKTFNLPASKNAYWFSTNPVYLERALKNQRADINTLGVVANEAAYRHGADWLDQLLVYIDGNHRFVEDYCRTKLPQVRYTKAQGTFLAWLHFDDVMDAAGVVEASRASQSTDSPMSETQMFEVWLAEHCHIQLNHGEDYGKGGRRCMRMNIGTSRRLLKLALDNLRQGIASL